MLEEIPSNQSIKHKSFMWDISSIGDEEWVMQSILDACQAFNTEIEYLSGNPCMQLGYCLDALPLIEMINRLGKLGTEIPDVPHEIATQKDNTISLVNQLENHVIEFLEQHGSREAKEKIARERDTLNVSLSSSSRDRAQYLISELRTIVVSSKTIDDDHRHRLIIRLEKLQLELHKSTSDKDRFLGLLNESGQAIGKFGDDIKPFIDRLRELANIFGVKSSSPKEIESSDDLILPPNENDEDTYEV